jgi:putative glutamine transport system permease protein
MDFQFIYEYRGEFLQGFLMTLLTSLLALVFSLLLGVVFATMRMSKIRILEAIGLAYVEFVRNTPILVIVFLFYYGLPILNMDLSEFQSGLIGISLYNGSFITEQIRAGIQSISRGQMEAARSSGMTYLQGMWHIVLPQAIKVVIPSIGNQLLNIVKGTSVLGVIAGGDLMYHADIVSSRTFIVFNVYLFVAFLYMLITVPLSWSIGKLERRWARH